MATEEFLKQNENSKDRPISYGLFIIAILLQISLIPPFGYLQMYLIVPIFIAPFYGMVFIVSLLAIPIDVICKKLKKRWLLLPLVGAITYYSMYEYSLYLAKKQISAFKQTITEPVFNLENDKYNLIFTQYTGAGDPQEHIKEVSQMIFGKTNIDNFYYAVRKKNAPSSRQKRNDDHQFKYYVYSRDLSFYETDSHPEYPIYYRYTAENKIGLLTSSFSQNYEIIKDWDYRSEVVGKKQVSLQIKVLNKYPIFFGLHNVFFKRTITQQPSFGLPGNPFFYQKAIYMENVLKENIFENTAIVSNNKKP